MLSPTKASISGMCGEWVHSKNGELIEPFWEKDQLTLGDFKELVKYLIVLLQTYNHILVLKQMVLYMQHY